MSMAVKPPRYVRPSVAIICDDSKTQRLDKTSPSSKRNRSVFGRVDFSKDIGDILRSHGMAFPTDDIESESEYKKVLAEYSRPIEDLLGGTYRSVSSLAKDLSQYAEVDTYVISRRYGLVKSDFVAIPYVCKRELYSSSAKNRWSSRVSDLLKTIVSQHDCLVLLLSTSSLEALLSKKDLNLLGSMKAEQCIHIVAAESFLSRLRQTRGPTLFTYPRVGVAPVTKSVKREIIAHIKKARS